MTTNDHETGRPCGRPEAASARWASTLGDQPTHATAPAASGLHAFANGLGLGELGKQLETPATPVRVEPLQLSNHAPRVPQSRSAVNTDH